MSTTVEYLGRTVGSIDLTGDDPVQPARGSFLIEKEEQEAPPLILLDDLENGDDDDDTEADDFIRRITPNERARIARSYAPDQPNPPRGRIYVEEETNSLGCKVEVGGDYELDGEEAFMRVIKIFIEREDGPHMQGRILVRARAVLDFLPKKCNELCAIVTAQADRGSKLPDVDEYLVTRPLSSAICRRTIIFTNQIFPLHSFREKGVGYKGWEDVRENAELVCRWKYIEFCDTVHWNVPSQALVRLRKHECDIGVADAQLMLAWRGLKAKSPSHAPSSHKPSKKRKMVNLTEDSDIEETTSMVEQTVKRVNRFGVYERRSNSTITERLTPQHYSSTGSRNSAYQSTKSPDSSDKSETYTIGDICAGAGGATTAAWLAGLLVSFTLDIAIDTCRTMHLNYPCTKNLNMDIFTFCNTKFKERSYMRVDVLHISFPCNYYSSAHTRDGKNDPENIAAGYSIMPLLEKCRPRIVTFEQSPNITKPKHEAAFRALIHQVTAMGYSIRWKIVNFAHYGNVQSRNRLFMIASCPGQPLPSFPKPTHGPGLRKYTTVNDILKEVPHPIKPHMAETVNWRYEKNSDPYDGNLPLRGAITCNGGDGNIHPNGKRPFNNQELAQLQGFPASHQFAGTKSSIMRQIGNAVPRKRQRPSSRRS